MAPNTTTYRCDECGKDINRKCDLDRHMKLHATNIEDLKIPCPYPDCNYKTLQCSNLKTHMYTHTRERPLKCPDEGCGYDTRDPGALTKHRQKKHGYVPKENTRKSSTGATRTTQQQTRFTPYNTSLRPSRSTITPEVPPQLPPDDACLASSDVGAGERTQALKNNTLAFETDLALKFARANGSNLETNVDAPGPSPSSSLPLTEPEVPTAEDTSLFEWQDLFTFDQFDELVHEPAHQSDEELEYFLANYDEYMVKALSAHGATEPEPFMPRVFQPTRQSHDELGRFLANYDEYIANASSSSTHNAISTPNPATAFSTNTINDASAFHEMENLFTF
ncbi:hypothetical protein JVU11DRAFT_8065 [Chiua virens]|nr:hypothetical protein JVU11DRAFT_8065 [Chiua virens]